MPRTKQPSDHRAVILLLGDNRRLAATLGIHHSTVCGWKSRSIPPRYWPQLVRLAKLGGLSLTVEHLEATAVPPPKRIRRLRCAA